MEVREIRKNLVQHLSSFEDGRRLLDLLLRDIVRYMLEMKLKETRLLKEIAFYRLDKDPSSAFSLLHVIRSELTRQDLDYILGLIRPLDIPEETLLKALSMIREVEKSEYRALRNSIRLIASFLLSGRKPETFSLDDALDAAIYVGDPEAYRAILRVIRGDKESLLTQAVAPSDLKRIPETRIPHAAILRAFSYVASISKGRFERPAIIDEKNLRRALEVFYREFEVSGWTPHTAAIFDRLRVTARFSPKNFLDEPYPGYLLELERMFFRVLRSSSSEVFKEMRPIIRKFVEKASAEGIMLTDQKMLEQTFVAPLEDLLIGLRYRGRELGRYVSRLISLLVPDLKEMIYLSEEYPNALFAVHSLYPEEIYVGRYIHVGIEAYVYGREEMVKTKTKIYKKTLLNLVEKFKDSEDERSKAKAAGRAVSLIEGRAYIWGLAPHLVRRHESASLYQQVNPIVDNIDDRLVRFYGFMRLFRSVHEGLLHLTLLKPKSRRQEISTIVADDFVELLPLVEATIHTIGENENVLIRLLGLSFGIWMFDAISAIIRVSSLWRGANSSKIYETYEVLRRLFEVSIPLIETGREHLDVFRVVSYPSFNPIFRVVLRRYQLIEAMRRAAIYAYFTGNYDLLPSLKEYLDERSLTAMEPRIFRFDPDVLVTMLPVTGGKKRFKLRRYSRGTREHTPARITFTPFSSRTSRIVWPEQCIGMAISMPASTK